tara:strand:+ start:53 stop:526 length:474 start_codon:yes stop_codon:yes gene_type:complete
MTKSCRVGNVERLHTRDKEYGEHYFLDYQDVERVKWVRIPNLRINEVIEYLEELTVWVMNGKIKHLRVQSETLLSRLAVTWDEEEERYVNDESTERSRNFDYFRYGKIEERFTGKSLDKRKDESLEEWKKRCLKDPKHNKYIPFKGDPKEKDFTDEN